MADRSDQSGRGAAYDIEIELSAVLGSATMPINQILKLGRGAVVTLDRKINEPVELFVNKTLVGRGDLIVVDDRLGVSVTEMLKGSGRNP